MRTIIIKVPVSQTEYNLLVAAKSDQPHPERMRALLVAEARSTLRRMIDMVDQERNAKFAADHKGEPKTVREHLRRPSKLVLKRAARNTRKPNHSDRSAQPEWLSDDNVNKLRS